MLVKNFILIASAVIIIYLGMEIYFTIYGKEIVYTLSEEELSRVIYWMYPYLEEHPELSVQKMFSLFINKFPHEITRGMDIETFHILYEQTKELIKEAVL